MLGQSDRRTDSGTDSGMGSSEPVLPDWAVPSEPQPLADDLAEQTAGSFAGSSADDGRAYAGFLRRTVAMAIDAYLCLMAAGGVMGVGLGLAGSPVPSRRAQMLIGLFGLLVMPVLLTAIPEASRWQTTIGKRLLGLIVTDRRGRRIGLGRSLVRYAARVVMIGLAFFAAAAVGAVARRRLRLSNMQEMMTAFTLFGLLLLLVHLSQRFSPQRQALHDRVAGTLVLRRHQSQRGQS